MTMNLSLPGSDDVLKWIDYLEKGKPLSTEERAALINFLLWAQPALHDILIKGITDKYVKANKETETKGKNENNT